MNFLSGDHSPGEDSMKISKKSIPESTYPKRKAMLLAENIFVLSPLLGFEYGQIRKLFKRKPWKSPG